MHSFEVENIKCSGCINTIFEALSQLDGVSNVSIDPETNILSFDADDKDLSLVEEKLKSLGYPKKDDLDLLQKAKDYLNKNQ